MRIVCWLVALLGIFIVGYSVLGFDTTIEGSSTFERVHNMGLMNVQLVIAMFGCAVFLAGVVLAASCSLGEAFQKAGKTETE